MQRVDNLIEVETIGYHPHGNGCTADASPTTSNVTVPPGIDPGTDVTVVVDGIDVVVPRRASSTVHA